ncbi:MAG TPA: hypothetical protein VM165_07825 [Planctomycetaceae bacterium]|nr:hypothetical protein [Planctomycetaceae bacterium]
MRYSLQFLVMVMAFVAAYFAGRASLTPIIREHERRDILQEQHLQALAKERSEWEARINLARQKKLNEEEARMRATLYELERTQQERGGPQLIPVVPPFNR